MSNVSSFKTFFWTPGNWPLVFPRGCLICSHDQRALLGLVISRPQKTGADRDRRFARGVKEEPTWALSAAGELPAHRRFHSQRGRHAI